MKVIPEHETNPTYSALITTTHHNMVDVVFYEGRKRNGASRCRNLVDAIEEASKYTSNISISQEAKNHNFLSH